MSYNNYPPPPGGGMRGPPTANTGYGHRPQPPAGAPASGPGGFGSQPPPPQQPPPQPQQQQQYSEYAPTSSGLQPGGDRGIGAPPGAAPPQRYGGGGGSGYGATAPHSQPSPPQHQRPPEQQSQRPFAPMAMTTSAFGGGTRGSGDPQSNGVRTGMGGMPPPPMTAPPRGGSGQGQQLNPQMAPVGAGGGGPASTGRGAQFYSVGLQGGAAPTPTPLQGGPPRGGPPTSMPPGTGMTMPPPPTGPGLAAQMGQMSLGPTTANGMVPASGGMGGGPPPQGHGMGYPRQGGGGYGPQGPPGPGGNPLAGGAGAPMGAATGGGLAGQAVLPSLHETDMSIRADPRVMRMTVGALPNSSSAHAQSKIPLGLVIQAMAIDLEEKDGGLEVVNFGAMGIVRCKRCRTYINPFVSWLSNGRQWRCNVCGMVNDVPQAYFCHLDQHGNRTDKDQRPELSNASVELVAPAEYMVRPPQPPVYMFVIDVSAPAVSSGMVHVAAETIKACLDNLPGEERTMVGVCTFDSSVHYYNLKANLSQPQMLVVPDLNDPFLPVPEDLLVNLSESRVVVDTLLDNLAQMHVHSRDAECCLGPALTAAGKVMGHVGGKMVVLCASLPSTGEARLKHRENPRVLGTDREHILLKPEDTWYQNKAMEFSKLQICVDLFLFSAQYTDIATVATLPKFTAGQLFYYPGFMAPRDGEKFHAELTRVLTRPTAFEAVMRVRATRGLRITNFYGNYFIRGTDLLALPNCTPDSVFAVEFGYDEQVLTASVISVQAALLYTTSCGERRIRVHNLAIPVETVIQNVFDSINIDVVCNIIAKQALEVALKTGLDAARSRIQQACIDMIRASRGGGYGASPYMTHGASQQQQPTKLAESIQLLPLYSMALQKNVAFRGGTDVRTDERANAMSQLANMPVEHSRCFTYPRMFRLHDMEEDAGLPLESQDSTDDLLPTAGTDAIKLPAVANLSEERLSEDGIFLLENGVELYLWVGPSASPALVLALFGIPSLEGQDLSSLQVQAEGNDLCRRVNTIISALREERMTYLKVIVVGRGDGQNEPNERRFYWHLVEDRASFPGGSMNYAEYMQHISRHSAGGMGPVVGY